MMASPRRHVCALAMLCVAVVTNVLHAGALEFDMVFQTKCVMEEIHEGTIVVGDYSGIWKDGTDGNVPLDAKVRDNTNAMPCHRRREYPRRRERHVRACATCYSCMPPPFCLGIHVHT
jgi:hypothetical protein